MQSTHDRAIELKYGLKTVATTEQIKPPDRALKQRYHVIADTPKTILRLQSMPVATRNYGRHLNVGIARRDHARRVRSSAMSYNLAKTRRTRRAASPSARHRARSSSASGHKPVDAIRYLNGTRRRDKDLTRHGSNFCAQGQPGRGHPELRRPSAPRARAQADADEESERSDAIESPRTTRSSSGDAHAGEALATRDARRRRRPPTRRRTLDGGCPRANPQLDRAAALLRRRCSASAARIVAADPRT